MPSLTLRDKARPDDVEAVARILNTANAFTPAEIDVARELVQENLDKGAAASGYHLLFAEVDGVVRGYVCHGPDACSDGACHLYWIAVDAAARGQGLARRLLDAACEAIRLAGGRKLYAETSSTEPYAAARGFYEHSGFTCEARLAEFYRPGDDKLIYVRSLMR